MKQIKKILSTYKRKIHIDGKEWTYQINNGSYNGFVKVCSPDRTQKWNLKIARVGHNYCDCCWECYCEEPYWNAMTPYHVKRLIEKRILGRKIPR